MALLPVAEALGPHPGRRRADARSRASASSRRAAACSPSTSPPCCTQPPFDASAMDGYARARRRPRARAGRACRSSARRRPGRRFGGRVGAGRGGAHLHRRPGARWRRHASSSRRTPSATATRCIVREGAEARRQHPPRRRRFPRGRDAARAPGRRLDAARHRARGRRRPRRARGAPQARASPSWRQATSWSSPATTPGPGQIVVLEHLRPCRAGRARRGTARLLGIAARHREAIAQPRFAARRGRRRPRDHRRRLGRRPRPGASGARSRRHGARLLEGRDASGQADDVRAPRRQRACSACRATPSRAWSPRACSSCR